MALDPEQFDTLARDVTETGRGRLLSDLSQMVLIDRKAGDVELEIFFDIVRAILGAAATDDRRDFAEAAADRSEVPHDLILVLAKDEARVAEPVLLRSVVLSDPDLIEIVQSRTDEHRLAIASRKQIAGPVSELLVRKGSRAVLHRLTANQGAVFSEHAVDELSHRAEEDEELYRILVDRDDLATLLARSMRETLRSLAVSAHRPNASGPKAAKSANARRKEQDAPVAAPPAPAKVVIDNPDVTVMAERIRAGEVSLSSAVAELAMHDHHADLACLLGAIAHIDESQIMRVLVRADSLGIATVARGLDIDAEAFGRIVELRRRRLKLSPTQAKFERDHFDQLDIEQARATIGAQKARRGRA